VSPIGLEALTSIPSIARTCKYKTIGPTLIVPDGDTFGLIKAIDGGTDQEVKRGQGTERAAAVTRLAGWGDPHQSASTGCSVSRETVKGRKAEARGPAEEV
jgi:hypothetical protein